MDLNESILERAKFHLDAISKLDKDIKNLESFVFKVVNDKAWDVFIEFAFTEENKTQSYTDEDDSNWSFFLGKRPERKDFIVNSNLFKITQSNTLKITEFIIDDMNNQKRRHLNSLKKLGFDIKQNP